MVFPHRRVGFADAAAPIPVWGWALSRSLLLATHGRQENRVAAGLNPAAPATPGRRQPAPGHQTEVGHKDMRENPDGFPSSPGRLRPFRYEDGLFPEAFSLPRMGGKKTELRPG